LPSDELIGSGAVHICVDMQRMFAEPTEWHAPWLNRILPAVEAITERHAARTIFTRFIPPPAPQAAHGAWRDYYARWDMMTLEQLERELIDLVPTLARHVPPAQVIDKPVYSPWLNTGLHERLRAHGITTLIITGGEAEVCVLATVLGAIDLGYRIVLPTDAVFSSADQTYDAIQTIFHNRFGVQLRTCSTEELLETWKA